MHSYSNITSRKGGVTSALFCLNPKLIFINCSFLVWFQHLILSNGFINRLYKVYILNLTPKNISKLASLYIFMTWKDERQGYITMYQCSNITSNTVKGIFSFLLTLNPSIAKHQVLMPVRNRFKWKRGRITKGHSSVTGQSNFVKIYFFDGLKHLWKACKSNLSSNFCK